MHVDRDSTVARCQATLGLGPTLIVSETVFGLNREGPLTRGRVCWGGGGGWGCARSNDVHKGNNEV